LFPLIGVFSFLPTEHTRRLGNPSTAKARSRRAEGRLVLSLGASSRGSVVGRWWAGGKRGKLWDDAGGVLAEGGAAGQHAITLVLFSQQSILNGLLVRTYSDLPSLSVQCTRFLATGPQMHTRRSELPRSTPHLFSPQLCGDGVFFSSAPLPSSHSPWCRPYSMNPRSPRSPIYHRPLPALASLLPCSSPTEPDAAHSDTQHRSHASSRANRCSDHGLAARVPSLLRMRLQPSIKLPTRMPPVCLSALARRAAPSSAALLPCINPELDRVRLHFCFRCGTRPPANLLR
ncbi:hypothetical protein B0H13DRAFT_1088894, partial [Mycena leptocephala]